MRASTDLGTLSDFFDRYGAALTAGDVPALAGCYRNAGQCSGLQAGGEGPRWEGRRARAVP
ncbi:hypothetical protein D7147_28870 [Micromonospora musae]|uniref:SnoaL-like domain-containing protein n=1 Tax=Micromonospora musae TaxID=1894970 RepID=A0ABX9QUZ5_9ACTN|nr:hypothetical protein D7147_28870 [Micromonospora musae]